MNEIAYETMKYQLQEEETKVVEVCIVNNLFLLMLLKLKKMLTSVEEERNIAVKHFDDIRAAIRQTTGVSDTGDMHSCVSEATQEVYHNAGCLLLLTYYRCNICERLLRVLKKRIPY